MSEFNKPKKIFSDIVPGKSRKDEEGKSRSGHSPEPVSSPRERELFHRALDEEMERREEAATEFFRRRDPEPVSGPKPDEDQAEPGEGAPAGDLEIKEWKPKGRKGRKWAMAGAAGGGAISLLVLVSTLFSHVTVSVSPRGETYPIAQTIRVTPAAKAINPAKSEMPGEFIELLGAKTVSVPATGSGNISARAEGKVVISNGYGTSPQMLVAGTRLAAPDGKIYLLKKSITVPGAKAKNGSLAPSSIETDAIASSPGAEYNRGETALKIVGFQGTPKYQAFTAGAKDGFSGGSRGQSKIAAKSDIEKAEEAATKELFAELNDSLKFKVPEEFVLIEGSREIEITEVKSPRTGQAVEEVKVTATGRARAMIFRERDETELLSALFSSSTPKSFLVGESELKRQSVSFNAREKVLSYVLKGTGNFSGRFEQDEMRNELRGKKIEEIDAYLHKVPGIRSYTLKAFPFWLSRAPSKESQFSLIIESLGKEAE